MFWSWSEELNELLIEEMHLGAGVSSVFVEDRRERPALHQLYKSKAENRDVSLPKMTEARITACMASEQGTSCGTVQDRQEQSARHQLNKSSAHNLNSSKVSENSPRGIN